MSLIRNVSPIYSSKALSISILSRYYTHLFHSDNDIANMPLTNLTNRCLGKGGHDATFHGDSVPPAACIKSNTGSLADNDRDISHQLEGHQEQLRLTKTTVVKEQPIVDTSTVEMQDSQNANIKGVATYAVSVSVEDFTALTFFLYNMLLVCHTRSPAANLKKEGLEVRENFEDLEHLRAFGGNALSRTSTASTDSSFEDFEERTTIPSLVQSPAKGCTRLLLYKDIRLGLGENWAIREGSLVVCLQPTYTILERGERQSDEFELFYGDIFVVCRMYADMWALCGKISFQLPIEASEDNGEVDRTPKGFENLGFLPLCSVTLAANFGAFNRRHSDYKNRYPKSNIFPGGGLRVTPFKRTHSLHASQGIFQKSKPEIRLPNLVFELSNNFSVVTKGRAYLPLKSETVPPPNHTESNEKTRGPTKFKKLWSLLFGSSDSSIPSELTANKELLN
jgi:hypothetical protein